ncbi:MAG: tetratricopeptide repeat protein [Pseudomonadota bacterium]
MKKPSLAAIAAAAMLLGLTACSGSYKSQIQGSYGTYFKKGSAALRAKDFDSAADHYAFAARSGHPRALIAYGRLFAKGDGVEQDPSRAAALFQEAYQKTSPMKAKAALELGQLYMKGGDGPSGEVEKDLSLARTFLSEALDGGEARAASSLGRIYDRGLGVDADPVAAIGFYRQASARDVNAARRLATLLTKTGGAEEEIAATAGRAVSALEARGEAGDGNAWMQLADIFARGQIVEVDRVRAVNYLERLPEDNDPKMNLRLAGLYGKIGDQAERKRRLRLAADAGETRAQTALAKLFLTPNTADTNGAVGRFYAERAIGNDSKSAMVHLGLALVRGDVLAREPKVGETLLRRAEKGGHLGAKVALGTSILSGDLPGREWDEGRELLEEAAKKGSPDAMSALGFGYHLGRGLPADKTLGLTWLRKAADAGQRDAKAFLSRLERAGA